MSPPLEKILFLAASALTDETERRLLLDRACGSDQALRRRVEELFAIQQAAADYLEAPTAGERTDAGEPAAQLGTRIGRYRLLRRIGEGGCGVVYLAEQTEPVRRQVALKIIRLGMDTEHVIARFEAERQALALMEHPHIARVLDAGATAAGRPFFVMEFVDGEKITDFCDARRLGLRARLELFVQLCLALQHAHQKGVIHRDIKPSNVLVRMHDGVPTAKVIDFGIAKATTANLGGQSVLTAVEQLVGTPAYLSPEMAAGGADVDTRSDIHSLGVMLHELLTGATPFAARLTGRSDPDAFRCILRDEDPRAPSVFLEGLASEELARVAERRGLEPGKLFQAVRGDLDWIALKALERDRERRYESAYGLAADVRRHLAHEPVSAGPPDRLYRLGKFIRRNRIAVASGALVALALAGGFGVSTVLFVREKHARAEQERLRAVAETARANEVTLRRQAEHRGMIAQAAVLLSHGELEAADDLLARVPFDQVPLSLEAAQSYARVGEWHVLAGRWREATERFAAVALVLPNVDPADSDAISIMLIPAAATLGLAGDRTRYDVIRASALDRFGATSRPVVAEQVVKIGVLLPASPAILAKVQPLAARLERAFAERHAELVNSPSRVAWSCFALGLLRYRDGDFGAARDWARRGLADEGINRSRDASARCLLAMAHFQHGEAAAARAELARARSALDAVFARNLPLGDVDSFWFDWVNARLLEREAVALIDGVGAVRDERGNITP